MIIAENSFCKIQTIEKFTLDNVLVMAAKLKAFEKCTIKIQSTSHVEKNREALLTFYSQITLVYLNIPQILKKGIPTKRYFLIYL